MTGLRRRVAPVLPSRLRPLLRRIRGWAWRLGDELRAVRWDRRHGHRGAPPSMGGLEERPLAPTSGHVLVIDASGPDPSRDAGSAFMLAIMRLLREDGYPVTFLPADGRMPDAGTAALRAIDVQTGSGIDVLDWLLAHGAGLSHAIVARPDVALRHLPRIRRWSRARILYYTHDLHALREERRYEVTGSPDALEALRRYRDVERAALIGADVVLTPSSAEVPEIRALAPGAVVRVIPPVVDRPGQADPLGDPERDGRRSILFVGTFTHAPNVDAARFLVLEVMPRVWERIPDAIVRVVGQHPPPEVVSLAAARVEVTGHVPDLSSFWADARLSVAPLRYGAGVKGKVLASLAAGVPVVTTSIGNEGIGLVDGQHALVSDTPDGLAEAIVALLEDEVLARELGKRGRRLLDERHSDEPARRELRLALGVAP